MSGEDLQVLRDRSFGALISLMKSWSETGRKTTTAGVTSALKQAGDLDLTALGFESNLEFWAAAEERGLVRRSRLANGHWYATLPGETPPQEPSRSAPSLDQIGEVWKLRDPVWDAFVDWTDEYRRFWDLRARRLYLVPNLAGWVPTQIDSRFVEIKPVTMATQIGWMTEFANSQDSEVKDVLLASLMPDAPRGAYRRALIQTQRLSAWRTLLRLRVAEQVLRWVVANDVDFTHLTERLVPRAPRNTPAPAPGGSERAASSTARGTHDEQPDERSDLRSLVHRVVDQMNEDDLKSLPLRGEHLLGL